MLAARMVPPDPSFAELRAAREQFLSLVAAIRPDLHRYCARMTGSVADGEDVVQDTLARAYYLLAELPAMPELRPWLFRVAHNRAIDFLRRYDRRMGEPLETDAPLDVIGADDALAQHEVVAAALTRFVELPALPRSCVILKDVLGHSLDDIAALLDLGLPAVKAALHRGRAKLRAALVEPAPPVPAPAASPVIARYIQLFNARDWDGVRAMLADDVRCDVVSRAQRRGRREVGQYTGNYDGSSDWFLHPAVVDGRQVIGVSRTPGAEAPSYFIELTLRGEQIVAIRDYRYVPYILRA